MEPPHRLGRGPSLIDVHRMASNSISSLMTTSVWLNSIDRWLHQTPRYEYCCAKIHTSQWPVDTGILLFIAQNLYKYLDKKYMYRKDTIRAGDHSTDMLGRDGT